MLTSFLEPAPKPNLLIFLHCVAKTVLGDESDIYVQISSHSIFSC
jgi:hypothetical protein